MGKKMSRVDWKDVLIRSVKTFIQVAIPLILTALTTIDYSGEGDTVKSFLIATCLSAAASGICAVWNGVINPLLSTSKDINSNNTAHDNVEKPEPKKEIPEEEIVLGSAAFDENFINEDPAEEEVDETR